MRIDSQAYTTWSPPVEIQPWWDALVCDTAAGVMVCDSAGRVLFANWVLACLYGDGHPEAMIGRTLDELMPVDAARERRELIVHVLTGGRARGLTEIWRGTALVCTGRRLPPSHNGHAPLCLITARRSAAPGADPGAAGVELVPARHSDTGPLGTLTQTELLVLSLIGKGLSTAEIAKQLYRSTKTVEWHRAAIGQKLGASSRAQLVRAAIQAGLC